MKEESWVDIVNGTPLEDLVTFEAIDSRIAEHEQAIVGYEKEIELSKKSIEMLLLKKRKMQFGEHSFEFEIAEELEKINTQFGLSPFEPTVLNWTDFKPELEIHDAEHHFYWLAVDFIKSCRDKDVHPRRVLSVMEKNLTR